MRRSVTSDQEISHQESIDLEFSDREVIDQRSSDSDLCALILNGLTENGFDRDQKLILWF